MNRLVVVLAALLSFGAIAQSEFPPPPAGYTWVNCPESKSAYLKPDGWFFKKVEKQSGTWGYFFTKENIDKQGAFTTGLSVNIVTKVPAKSGAPAPDYAAAFINEAAQANKMLVEPWHKKLGPFHQYGVRTLVSDPKGGDFITHMLAIGNEDTGTVYVLNFEAPAASWEAAWKVREPILKKFLIDTDV
ncbi:MAG: hypothetical protein WC809_14095 [Sinimarinibacterium sp.]|jgi:hypothetical protein